MYPSSSGTEVRASEPAEPASQRASEYVLTQVVFLDVIPERAERHAEELRRAHLDAIGALQRLRDGSRARSP